MATDSISTSIARALQDEPAKREVKPLETVLSDQSMLLPRLAEELSRLEDVLKPVLSESEPVDSGIDKSTMPGTSGVVTMLASNNQSLDFLSYRIKNLIRRVEV